MFFTQEDYRKIVQYLRLNSYKDTDFPSIGEMNLQDEDIITIVHNGVNYKVPLRKLIAAIGSSEDTVKTVHSINVSFITDEGETLTRFVKYSTTEEAINAVPAKYRFPGIGVTWVDTNNVWKTYQFKGTSAEQWDDLSQFVPYNLADEIHENEGLNPGDSGYIEDSSEVGVTQRLLQEKVLELKNAQTTTEGTLRSYTDTEVQTAKASLLGNASEAGNTLGKLESMISNKSGIVKVAVLPNYSEDVLNKIYLVPNSEDNNIYDAFYYDSGWKQVGGVDPTINQYEYYER